MMWKKLSYKSRYSLLWGGIPFLLAVVLAFLVFTVLGEGGFVIGMLAILCFVLAILGTVIGFVIGIIKDKKQGKKGWGAGFWIMVGLIVLTILVVFYRLGW